MNASPDVSSLKSVPAEPLALSHIEKTFGDSYRKEIDQEENIWRSLPFFAATIALQLAAIFQISEKIAHLTGNYSVIAYVILTVNAVTTLIALGFLAASIYPAKFSYIAPEPELLAYAKGLIDDEASAAASPEATPISALVTLKEALAKQYAVGAQHNRQINKRRELRRSIAGLATLISVLLTLLLVGAAFIR